MPENKKTISQIEEYIACSRKELLSDLRELVRIPSVSCAGADGLPFGAPCRDVLEKALEIARRRGIRAENHQNRYVLAELGEGEKTIGIFCHLDVVPAGGGWQYPPFEVTEKDGLLIGRGVCDNKGGAAAMLCVLSAFRELNLPLHSRLRLFLGASEETGMEDIDSFCRQQPMPDFSLVPDAGFPVCHGEKGIMGVAVSAGRPFAEVLELTGGTAENMVADAARARLVFSPALARALTRAARERADLSITVGETEIAVEARGLSAHASLPEGSCNAIGLLAAFLAGIDALNTSDRQLLADAARTMADHYGEALGIAEEDVPSGRLTCICGLAQTEEGRLCLHYNIRYPVTGSGERVAAGVKRFFARAGWGTPEIQDSPPCYLAADDPMVAALSRLYREITGRDSTPYVMGGGTYARHLQNAVSFGLEPPQAPDGFAPGHGGIHQPDEAISMDGLMEGVRIYIASILELDKILNG